MGLREIESSLPPGFRFYPSDEELVCHYLYRKVTNHKITEGTMVEVDLHTREPWELPEVAKLSENEWYFFSFRDRKYATGVRTNRATKSGYWKATGKDRIIYNPKTHGVVGMRKTLVFYQGRAPNGMKTNWVMHEFRLENTLTQPKEDWVLCRVFNKRKGETSVIRAGFQNAEQENINGFSGSPLELSAADEIGQLGNMPEDFNGEMGSAIPHNIPHQDGNSSNTYLNFAVLQYNFFDFPQEMMSTTDHMMGMESKLGGDEFGFLLDMGLNDEHEIGGGILDSVESLICQDGKGKLVSF